jgi:hypothetical protein
MERLVILASCWLTFMPSFAFTLNNNVAASFEQDQVKVNVATHTCNKIGVTNDELLSLAEEAGALYWNRVHTSRLEIVRGSLVSVDGVFQNGEICTNFPSSPCNINTSMAVSSDILISCNITSSNYSGSPSVLGVTLPNNVSGQTIRGALILVNDASNNSFKDLSRSEKIAVLAHEIGHAVGLGHSNFDKNLMYYQSVATRETLGPDDVDGITYLYPVEQPFGGCGSVGLIPEHDSHNHLGAQAPKKRTSALFLVLVGLGLGLGLSAIGKTWQKSVPL